MKKLLAMILCAVLLLSLAACGAKQEEAPATGGEKVSFTVIVVHKDGSEKKFEYRTDAEFLGEALVEKELIVGHDDIYGLVVDYVDGERAAWDKDNAFWNIYIGEEAAVEGISKIPVHDGDTFKLVYTPFN